MKFMNLIYQIFQFTYNIFIHVDLTIQVNYFIAGKRFYEGGEN